MARTDRPKADAPRGRVRGPARTWSGNPLFAPPSMRDASTGIYGIPRWCRAGRQGLLHPPRRPAQRPGDPDTGQTCHGRLQLCPARLSALHFPPVPNKARRDRGNTGNYVGKTARCGASAQVLPKPEPDSQTPPWPERNDSPIGRRPLVRPHRAVRPFHDTDAAAAAAAAAASARSQQT
ncbi:hypothetical protein CDD83_8200 [Cordyceps sp. RAO-2017]|nr:hypothetical protein CDD83_8200 [Cordyceps sp. RAO-2017]